MRITEPRKLCLQSPRNKWRKQCFLEKYNRYGRQKLYCVLRGDKAGAEEGEGKNKKCAQQSCREDPRCSRELTMRNGLNSSFSSRVFNHVAWAPSTVTQVSTCIPMTCSPWRPISPRSHFSRPPNEWSQEKDHETKQTWLSLAQFEKYFILRQKWHHLRKRSKSV